MSDPASSIHPSIPIQTSTVTLSLSLSISFIIIMKNLELIDKRIEVPATRQEEEEQNDDDDDDDVAVAMATLSASDAQMILAENPQKEQSYDEDYDDDSLVHVILYQSGTLVCCSSNNNKKNNTILWKVNLNSVLEDDNDENETPSSPNNSNNHHHWFHVHLFQSQSTSSTIATQSSLACFNHSGAIVTLQITGQDLQLVGAFEQGILAVSIWHDMVALVVTQDDDDEHDEGEENNQQQQVITQQQQHVMLLTMTLDFEVLQEIVLDTLTTPQAQELFRFQQSTTDTKNVIQSIVSLGWRPDGKWLAVALPNSNPNPTESSSAAGQPSTLLRIYDPQNLHASPSLGRTEDASGKLLPGLHMPSSSSATLGWANETCSHHLAVFQATGKSKRTMVLVEPNGLAHGGLTLPKHTQHVHRWTFCHSTHYNLLALHVTKNSTTATTTTQPQQSIQLWHRSNYHWYLKHEITMDHANDHIAHVEWQDSVQQQHHGGIVTSTPAASTTASSNHELVLLTRQGSIQRHQFIWKEPASTTAMVVDGAKLLLTPLHHALVPPPMASCTVDMPQTIRQVVALATANDHKLPSEVSLTALVVLSNHQVLLLGKNQSTTTSAATTRTKFVPPDILATADLRQALPPSLPSLHQLTVLDVATTGNDDVMLQCVSLTADQKLLELKIKYNASSHALSIVLEGQLDLPGRVLALTTWVEHGPFNSEKSSPHSALLELTDGQLLEYTREADAPSGSIHEAGLEPLLEPCPWIVGLKSRDTGEHRILGMSWQRRLYCGDMLLSDAITTFHVTDRFLIYATADVSAGQLKFIALQQLWELDPFMGASEENLAVIAAEYEPRTVERGSRIVTCLQQNQKPMVVLQLPRGNLEGVSPRALVLPHVLHQLAVQGNYKAALVMARQQKLDLNLLVDWNPMEFIENGAREMVQQVTNVDHLNLFISSLRNENVTQTRHILPRWLLDEFHLSKDDRNSGFDFSSKVNVVCKTLRSIIMEMEKQDTLLLPLLSTYAKEEPPQLEAALSMIQKSALSIQSNSRKPPLFLERAQSSIQYLAFLATYELLFDTAIGMYELDLARAVARNSQLDPKMYLPLLKRYRELPKFYARYEIDLRLKRYPNALRNLVESFQAKETAADANDDSTEDYMVKNSLTDAIALVKQHKLHRLGLELFPKNEHREILLDLGEHLLASGEAENALTIFLTVSQPEPRVQIMKASRKCKDWRTLFSYFVPSEPVEGLEGTMSPSDLLIIREVVQEMVASVTSASLTTKRTTLADAARIMLDYCDDSAEAVDLLIQGQLWSEARRVAAMKEDTSLVEKCEEAAAAFAHVSMDDLAERASSFVETMKRYGEVLILRKEAYARGEDLPPGDDEPDETGSLFSAASQASHLTGMSQTSSSSTSTSASYSTVISVTSNASSFSLVGTDQSLRHKSKYNQVGQKGRKKKKKGKKKSSRILPGSEKEFEKVVENLGVLCLDSDISASVSDCAIFLVRCNQFAVGSALYEAYVAAVQKIREAQEKQQQVEKEAIRTQEETNRREGIREEIFFHPLQNKIAALQCHDVNASVYKFFDLLPKMDSNESDY